MQKYVVYIPSVATSEKGKYWFCHKQDVTILWNGHPSGILTDRIGLNHLG